MGILRKLRTVFRGDVSLADLTREALRRGLSARRQKIEIRQLESINGEPARLTSKAALLTGAELLSQFRDRDLSFFPVTSSSTHQPIAKLQSELFPDETGLLIRNAARIVHESIWDVAGFGTLDLSGEDAWRRDPLSGEYWGTEYHADVVVYRDGGPDIRVLWELNRFGHAITLARAFAVTRDEAYAETFFTQIDSWMSQNPYGRGANWNCAMEVALRAINLLAAFDIFRSSAACSQSRLLKILQFFDQHGRFILDNNEFSYLATSNHYLSDVVGLFWIGTLLPELEHATEWREFGLSEILREMNKQILPDGADFEASTGYHKFVTEMLLYTFLLGKNNSIEIGGEYWDKLREMLDYLATLARPDGRFPLIGDADGSQIVPVLMHDADDAAYLVALGAVVFVEPKFKVGTRLTPEILWVLGEKGVDAYRSLGAPPGSQGSVAFPDAGAYVLRDGDLYLHLNTNDCGLNGRGSHAHNDALSIELSAYGRAFIIDPGSYVYNFDRDARHIFRSTAYHSTVMVDGAQQNTTRSDLPFVLGNQARPHVLSWNPGAAGDRVSAEHFGYGRLPDPIRHRRTIDFNKVDKYWLIEDVMEGVGEHEFTFSFHLAPDLTIDHIDDMTLQIGDDDGRKLLIGVKGIEGKPEVAAAWRSVGYGHKEPSQIVKWSALAAAPLVVSFAMVPLAPNERMGSGLALVERLTQNVGS